LISLRPDYRNVLPEISHFDLSPTGRRAAFSKEGKWIIENEGAAPDYEVEFTPALVVQGHDPQLEKAVELVLEALKNNPPKKTARPAYPIRN